MEHKPLTPEDIIAIEAAMAELDPRQAEIDRHLTLAQRFHKGFAMVEAARRYNIYRLRKENPELSEAEAQRIALGRYYALEDRMNAPR
jgi:hypothetical protein